MRIIISNYSSFYESIHTEDAPCMLWIKLKYHLKGYRVWAFPTLWMAKLWYKFTGKSIYRGTNVSFEKYILGSDQITYWSPYDNFR
jgi:hypothetical protein